MHRNILEIQLDLILAKKVWTLIDSSQRKSAYLLIFLIVIGMIAEMLSIGVIVPVLTLISQPNISVNHPIINFWLITLFGSNPQYIYVVYSLLLLIFLYVSKSIFLVFLGFKQSQFAYNAQKNLSFKMFAMYLKQPMTFYMQRNSSQMVNTILSEAVVFRDTMLLAVMLIAEILVLLGMILLALIWEPVGALVIFSLLGFFGWLFQHVTKNFVSNHAALRQKYDADKTLHLQQGLGSIKEIKVLGCEREFLNRFEMPNAKSADSGMYFASMVNTPRLWMETLCVLTMSAALIYLTIEKIDIVFAIPSMGLFLAIIFRLLPSSNRLLGAIQGIRYGVPSINHIYSEFLSNHLVENFERKNKVDMKLLSCIRLDNVCFTYPSAKKTIINNLSMIIRKGEVVGIYGSSGSGKSTILDMIIGLISPKSGVISVDGKDINLDIRSWQDNIGYIPQSIFLTDDTISKNVAFGVEESIINETKILSCIRDAQLEDWVNSLPNKLNTVVGEGGMLMSGGQRQRIAIARALYRDAPILILDEATSSLDIKAEQEVMEAVNHLKGSKTIIIVAHRLSTLSICDRLFKFGSSGLHEVQNIEN